MTPQGIQVTHHPESSLLPRLSVNIGNYAPLFFGLSWAGLALRAEEIQGRTRGSLAAGGGERQPSGEEPLPPPPPAATPTMLSVKHIQQTLLVERLHMLFPLLGMLFPRSAQDHLFLAVDILIQVSPPQGDHP